MARRTSAAAVAGPLAATPAATPDRYNRPPMTNAPLRPLTPDRPRRWPYYLAGALALGAIFAALAPGGPGGGYGARAGRYALTAGDLAAAAADAGGDADGGGAARGWIAGPGPVDFGQVFSAARALPDVSAPDDRHVAAFRAADGSEVFQVTALYDDAAKAEALVNSGAVGLLSSSFGLSSAPTDLPGTDDARRWTGAGFEGLSFRLDGAVVFVGTRGAGAPAAAALAAVVRDRLASSPPATATPVSASAP